MTQRILLHEVAYHEFGVKRAAGKSAVVEILADVGQGVVGAGQDVVGGVSFLGSILAALGRVVVNPKRFRFTSLVFHLEAVGFRSVPIITLISFLVGCIVAQQGIFQLRRFGATPSWSTSRLSSRCANWACCSHPSWWRGAPARLSRLRSAP